MTGTPSARPSAAVVDTTGSPHARLRPVPLAAVRLADAFWAPRRAINRTVTLPAQHDLLETTGRLDNFRRAAGALDGPFQGRVFNDSDIYKWLEAVAWTLADEPDPLLDTLADRVIAVVAAAQQPDGYLNTYFMFDRADQRWTDVDQHELYCAGHLFQAAVAHYRATAKTSLLDIATRFADHICTILQPQARGQQYPADGHPEVELALVELYRVTGRRAYLEQAQRLLDARGCGRLGQPYGLFGPEYHQDHQPFRELSRVAGHAVRAMYLNSGAADLLAETGEAALRSALERMWTNMTATQSYINGGIGARYEGEALGDEYELPNARAYTETCAAIGGLMWAWRMLLLSGDARYSDMLETALYNGILSGVSLAGDAYFYQNPLADDGDRRRQPWFGTACCPPNIARLLAALPGYLYSVAAGEIWVHLYVQGTARIPLPDGREIALAQRTGYPWDGAVELEIGSAGTFSLLLRIPAWCDTGATLEVNGQPWPAELLPGSYTPILRTWAAGDRVRLHLPMPVRSMRCHPYVTENAGRAALMRGPLLYCVEAVDHPGIDVRDLILTPETRLEAVPWAEVLGGVVVLRGLAEQVSPRPQWQGQLYRAVEAVEEVPLPQSVPLTAVPYYAWANRAPGRMQVWLPTTGRGRW